MKLLALSCALVAGCSFKPPPGEVVIDGPVDMPGDGPPGGCTIWPAKNIENPCSPLLGTAEDLVLTPGLYKLDTTTGMLVSPANVVRTLPGTLFAQPSGPMVRAINLSGIDVQLNATLEILGMYPVVFVVHGAVTVVGDIDGSARIVGTPGDSTPGPGGSDPAICNGTKVGTGDNGVASLNTTSGGGGAGGGAFGETGGNGTDGNAGGHGAGGMGGAKAGTADLVPLRAGCAGGTGGDDGDVALASGGRRGDGGGAVEITALGMISVSGGLRAAGLAGAGAGLERAGGGGGGSGGAILLDGAAVAISATARLCANGGGGGEGGQTGIGGVSGENGSCSETVPGNGGRSAAQGGDGGNGGYAAVPKGANAAAANSAAGGGGGGGSIGRIHVVSRDVTATIDAASTISPNAM